VQKLLAAGKQAMQSRQFYRVFLAVALVWLLAMMGAYNTLRVQPVHVAERMTVVYEQAHSKLQHMNTENVDMPHLMGDSLINW
jgi:hypothetical protein